MPNHFHLVLWPHEDGDLSRWMQWLLTTHVRRYHRHYRGSGHVWQGRFKAFPIEEDEHLLTVLRYVERNPLRAKLVRRAENWRWSSLTRRDEWLHPGPVERGEGWIEWVNKPQTEAEEQSLRALGESRHAVWLMRLAGPSRPAVGPGNHASAAWPTAEGTGKVECPLFKLFKRSLLGTAGPVRGHVTPVSPASGSRSPTPRSGPGRCRR